MNDATMAGVRHTEGMTAHELAVYLRRIRLARSIDTLREIAAECERLHGCDEATPRLMAMCRAKANRLIGVIAVKVKQLVKARRLDLLNE